MPITNLIFMGMVSLCLHLFPAHDARQASCTCSSSQRHKKSASAGTSVLEKHASAVVAQIVSLPLSGKHCLVAALVPDNIDW